VHGSHFDVPKKIKPRLAQALTTEASSASACGNRTAEWPLPRNPFFLKTSFLHFPLQGAAYDCRPANRLIRRTRPAKAGLPRKQAVSNKLLATATATVAAWVPGTGLRSRRKILSAAWIPPRNPV
jgi:hypothetical protein